MILNRADLLRLSNGLIIMVTRTLRRIRPDWEIYSIIIRKQAELILETATRFINPIQHYKPYHLAELLLPPGLH